MGDRELAQTIAFGFLTDMPKQLIALQSHLTVRDTHAAALLAHRMKGAAASVSCGHSRRWRVRWRRPARREIYTQWWLTSNPETARRGISANGFAEFAGSSAFGVERSGRWGPVSTIGATSQHRYYWAKECRTT
jgi:hypothetical protein